MLKDWKVSWQRIQLKMRVFTFHQIYLSRESRKGREVNSNNNNKKVQVLVQAQINLLIQNKWYKWIKKALRGKYPKYLWMKSCQAHELDEYIFDCLAAIYILFLFIFFRIFPFHNFLFPMSFILITWIWVINISIISRWSL